MKQKLLTFLIALFVSLTCPAKTSGSDCLGVWCTIDVNLNELTNREARYTITVPPEGIAPELHYSSLSIQGPGSPHLFNYLGTTVDIIFLKNQFLAEYEEEPTERFCELYVDKYVDAWGVPSSSGNQCYYLIRLLIRKNSI